MKLSTRDLWRSYGPFLFRPGDESGGESTTTTTAAPANPDADIDAMDVSDSVKTTLRKERQARRDAERDARQARDAKASIEQERDALATERDQRNADEQKRIDDEARQRGEYEKLATTREQERDAARDTVKRLEAENVRLRETIDAAVKDDWDKLPATVRDVYSGSDDDPVAKFAWLPKARALVEQIEGSQQQNGHQDDPPPKHGEKDRQKIVDQEIALMRQRGSYAM